MKKRLSTILTLESKGPEETRELGERMGKRLSPGDFVALFGDLGAGKTCLTQGIGAGLGVDGRERIASPSFTVIKEYKGRIPLYHVDLFRINSLEEIYDLGYEEYFYGDGVVVVEWAERCGPLLPVRHLAVRLAVIGINERKIEIVPGGIG